VTAGSSRPLAVTALPAGLTDFEPHAGGSLGAVSTLPRDVHNPLAPQLTTPKAASVDPSRTLRPAPCFLHRDRFYVSASVATHPERAKSRQTDLALRSRRIESNRGLCRG